MSGGNVADADISIDLTRAFYADNASIERVAGTVLGVTPPY